MVDWILGRPTIIALAVLGGIFAILSAVLRSRGRQHERRVKQLGLISYVFMGISIALFVIGGFWRSRS